MSSEEGDAVEVLLIDQKSGVVEAESDEISLVNLVRFSGSNVISPQVLLWSRLSVFLIGLLKRRMI